MKSTKKSREILASILREKLDNINISELSRRSGVTRQTIMNLKDNNNTPYQSSLNKLFEALQEIKEENGK